MPKPDIALHLLVMIRTFSAKLRALSQSLIGRDPSGRKPDSSGHGRRGPLPVRVSLPSEAGDTLMEVVISALVVGLIVVGTLTGFSVVNRASADQRHHSQASLLASQSQEQLRSDTRDRARHARVHPPYLHPRRRRNDLHDHPGSPADRLHGDDLGLQRQQRNRPDRAYIRSSSVTWPQLKAAKRTAMKQSTLITPPTGSDLEVDVEDGATPRSASPASRRAPKPPQKKPARQQSKERPAPPAAWSSPASRPRAPRLDRRKDRLRDPQRHARSAHQRSQNRTKHHNPHPLRTTKQARFPAEYTYEGKPKWEHLNNEHSAKVKKKVVGDTFTAYNVKIPAEPKFEVGPGEQLYIHKNGRRRRYKALTTLVARSATTAHGQNSPAATSFRSRKMAGLHAATAPPTASKA